MAMFECAVCRSRRREETAKGPGFILTPNGGKICNECVTNKDRVDMLEKGQVTLYLAAGNGGNWLAVNRTGDLRYPLLDVLGLGQAEVEAGAPRFIDPDGIEWRGRFYPATKALVFQRKKAVAGATARIAAGHVPATARGKKNGSAGGRKGKTRAKAKA